MQPLHATIRAVALATLSLVAAAHADATAPTRGYYRMPAIHGDTLVFVSEGDLWRVNINGGDATRLTSHAGEERDPSISPDGTTLAFTATYEGPREVYTMPLVGGLPMRRTWDAGRVGTTARPNCRARRIERSVAPILGMDSPPVARTNAGAVTTPRGVSTLNSVPRVTAPIR